MTQQCEKCGREGPHGECIGCGHWNDGAVLLGNGETKTLDKAFFEKLFADLDAPESNSEETKR